MAKLNTTRARLLAKFESPNHLRRYALRSDGVILGIWLDGNGNQVGVWTVRKLKDFPKLHGQELDMSIDATEWFASHGYERIS